MEDAQGAVEEAQRLGLLARLQQAGGPSTAEELARCGPQQQLPHRFQWCSGLKTHYTDSTWDVGPQGLLPLLQAAGFDRRGAAAALPARRRCVRFTNPTPCRPTMQSAGHC
jgi:hypothetical protein